MWTNKIMSLCVIGAFTLAGCTGTGMNNGMPRTMPNDAQKTKSGAGIGAVVGGVLGAAAAKNKGDRLESALKGAVIGGGLGAAGGYVLDRQAEELRRDLGNDAIGIKNTGNELIVTMPQDLLFATNSADLSSTLIRDLGVVSQSLLNYPASTIQVRGHTDNTGSAAYNMDLSQKRSRAVSEVLYKNGVPYTRVRPIGLGEDQPVATNLTAAGKAQNRRVEIVIVPNQS